MLLGAGVLELSRLGLTAGLCIQGLLLQRKLKVLCVVFSANFGAASKNPGLVISDALR